MAHDFSNIMEGSTTCKHYMDVCSELRNDFSSATKGSITYKHKHVREIIRK